MHLYELCEQLSPTDLSVCALPAFILGCFRRKTITFCDGLTDEKTIVYWFQSASFTIDLRLSEPMTTPILQRQGWVADTIWTSQSELLSWRQLSSYQTHIQWAEPARLYAMGNSIFEFSPNHSYVEDWRQQATTGRYLGLKLTHARHIASGQILSLSGGIIVCENSVAYVQSRLPTLQNQLEKYLANHGITTLGELTPDQLAQVAPLIEAYETSVSCSGDIIDYSTQANKQGQPLDLTGFEQSDNQVVQYKTINGEDYCLYFTLDVWQPNYTFAQQSPIHPATQTWLQQETRHLHQHAVPVF